MQWKTLLERYWDELLSVHVVEPLRERAILSLEKLSSVLRDRSLVVFIVVWRGDPREISEIRDSVDLMTISTLNSSCRSSLSKLINLVSQGDHIKGLLLIVDERLLVPIFFLEDVVRLWIRSISLLLHFTIVKGSCLLWSWQSKRISDLVLLHLALLIMSLPICVEVHRSLEKTRCSINNHMLLVLRWNELGVCAYFLICNSILNESLLWRLLCQSLLLRFEDLWVNCRLEPFKWYLVKTKGVEILVFLGPVHIHDVFKFRYALIYAVEVLLGILFVVKSGGEQSVLGARPYNRLRVIHEDTAAITRASVSCSRQRSLSCDH